MESTSKAKQIAKAAIKNAKDAPRIDPRQASKGITLDQAVQTILTHLGRTGGTPPCAAAAPPGQNLDPPQKKRPKPKVWPHRVVLTVLQDIIIEMLEDREAIPEETKYLHLSYLFDTYSRYRGSFYEEAYNFEPKENAVGFIAGEE